MNNKLTLRMDESLIASAKDYAAAHHSSVSQIVANYFAALAQKNPIPSVTTDESTATPEGSTGSADDWESKLFPLTRRLLGAAAPTDGSPAPTMEDYYAHLEAKHSRHLRDPAP
ncbi:MAG: hypothetical protein CFE39_17050 [Comamonadaceae bacterium PBBC2]|nr:MAG: hypothetical protein CFE39_17050 [Comamonadaceae bacterium PBBC2]